MDDAMSVRKAAVKMQKSLNMEIFGSSIGGGITLALILRYKQEHMPRRSGGFASSR
jgi:monoterpene epsilon-lactone hydrolase